MNNILKTQMTHKDENNEIYNIIRVDISISKLYIFKYRNKSLQPVNIDTIKIIESKFKPKVSIVNGDKLYIFNLSNISRKRNIKYIIKDNSISLSKPDPVNYDMNNENYKNMTYYEIKKFYKYVCEQKNIKRASLRNKKVFFINELNKILQINEEKLFNAEPVEEKNNSNELQKNNIEENQTKEHLKMFLIKNKNCFKVKEYQTENNNCALGVIYKTNDKNKFKEIREKYNIPKEKLISCEEILKICNNEKIKFCIMDINKNPLYSNEEQENKIDLFILYDEKHYYEITNHKIGTGLKAKPKENNNNTNIKELSGGRRKKETKKQKAKRLKTKKQREKLRKKRMKEQIRQIKKEGKQIKKIRKAINNERYLNKDIKINLKGIKNRNRIIRDMNILAGRKQLLLKINDEKIFTLNTHNRKTIYKAIKEGLIKEDEEKKDYLSGSDGEIIDHIINVDEIILSYTGKNMGTNNERRTRAIEREEEKEFERSIILNNTRKQKREGAFFPYFNKSEININLEKYGIYRRFERNKAGQIINYKDNCLMRSFKESGLYKKEELDNLKQDYFNNMYMSFTDVRRIAEKLKIYIEIKKYDKNRKDKYIKIKYGKKKWKKKIFLGHICDHFFINDKIEITKFYINNYDKISRLIRDIPSLKVEYTNITGHRENKNTKYKQGWHKLKLLKITRIKKNKTGYKFEFNDKAKKLTSFQYITFLYENKDEFLKFIGDDPKIYETQYFNTTNNINNLTYNPNQIKINEREIINTETGEFEIINKDLKSRNIVGFDFETITKVEQESKTDDGYELKNNLNHKPIIVAYEQIKDLDILKIKEYETEKEYYRLLKNKKPVKAVKKEIKYKFENYEDGNLIKKSFIYKGKSQRQLSEQEQKEIIIIDKLINQIKEEYNKKIKNITDNKRLKQRTREIKQGKLIRELYKKVKYYEDKKKYITEYDFINEFLESLEDYGETAREINPKTNYDCKTEETYLLSAHNAYYDFSRLAHKLKRIRRTPRGGSNFSLCCAEGIYIDRKNKVIKKLYFNDTYNFISTKLTKFSKMFGIDTKKEILPYDLYTNKTILKDTIEIKRALKYIKKDEHKEFLENLNKWNLISETDPTKFKHMEYNKIYCAGDVNLMMKGLLIFRHQIKEFTNGKMDILTNLTITQFAHEYMTNEGCYNRIYKFNNNIREFLQKQIKGGIVQTRNNKKWKINIELNDFDGVSLYPSAMYYIDGLAKGLPIPFDNNEPNKAKGINIYDYKIKCFEYLLKEIEYYGFTYKNESNAFGDHQKAGYYPKTYNKEYLIKEIEKTKTEQRKRILIKELKKSEQMEEDLKGVNRVVKVISKLERLFYTADYMRYNNFEDTKAELAKIKAEKKEFYNNNKIFGGVYIHNELKQIYKNRKTNDIEEIITKLKNKLDKIKSDKKKYMKQKQKFNFEYLQTKDYYNIEIKITKINKHRAFPLISVLKETERKNHKGDITKSKSRVYSNNHIGEIINVDKTELEDLIKFQDIEYEIRRGYYFEEGLENRINKVIKNLFEERLKKKKEGNPIQLVLKLIMNSAYGKTIQRPIETEHIYKESEDFYNYIKNHYNQIKGPITAIKDENGDIIRYFITKKKAIKQHYNMAHVGGAILSRSKRIINEVQTLAEDNNIYIFYMDTDSIHIENNKIDLLSKKYKETYGRELIGKNLGQFHNDFDFKPTLKTKDKILIDEGKIKAVQTIILGKKFYFDKLEAPIIKFDKKTLKSEQIINNSYHMRLKGISHNCFNNELEYVNNMYQDLLQAKPVKFNLAKNKAKFKSEADLSIKSIDKFERVAYFPGDYNEVNYNEKGEIIITCNGKKV